MRLAERGTSTSRVEVLNVSAYGIWLHVRGQEYFLPYGQEKRQKKRRHEIGIVPPEFKSESPKWLKREGTPA